MFSLAYDTELRPPLSDGAESLEIRGLGDATHCVVFCWAWPRYLSRCCCCARPLVDDTNTHPPTGASPMPIGPEYLDTIIIIRH